MEGSWRDKVLTSGGRGGKVYDSDGASEMLFGSDDELIYGTNDELIYDHLNSRNVWEGVEVNYEHSHCKGDCSSAFGIPKAIVHLLLASQR